MSRRDLTCDLHRSGQGWCLSNIVAVDSHRFRVEIRRDAYDDQSYARCDRWDGSAWQPVVDRPIAATPVGATRDLSIGERAVPVVSYTARELSSAQQALFWQTASELVDVALAVVND